MIIYYTLGPQCLEIPERMMEAGARGARLTFSFGTPDIQHSRATRLREVSKKLGIDFEIIADLEGGGSRIGEFESSDGVEFLTLRKGQIVHFVNALSSEIRNDRLLVPVPDKEVYDALDVGNTVCIGDGSGYISIIECLSDSKSGEIVFDCQIEGRRGILIQGSGVEPACITNKDRDSLTHIANNAVDYNVVALSFVSSASDVLEARHILGEAGSNIGIMAKIETPSGVKNIKEICETADSIMVARGDLALTQDWRMLPESVKQIVHEANRQEKPWIMATEVASGFMHHNMLTRSEICDAWHNISLGTAGFLLSRETAWGPRPADAVHSLSRLIDYAKNT